MDALDKQAERLKGELIEIAYEHLRAMNIPSSVVLDVGNRLFCGSEKRSHEGAFLCWAGLRLKLKEKR